MSLNELHGEWLSLIEISGPFLAVPVLKEAFPQGLEELDGLKRRRLRQAYEEWREALENDDPRCNDFHQAWIAEVLNRGLELDEDGRGDVLKIGPAIPEKLCVSLPEHGVQLAPDAAVIDEQTGNALMLIQTLPANVDLDAVTKRDGWASSQAERMVQLCRQTGCRLGLVTNGERWMLVDAPVGAVTSFASWYARLWGQEPLTLQAFVHLLGIRRFFVDVSERLPALLDRSLKFQDEVTDALGEQVRRAVEVLIQALDKADIDRDRTLLEGVPPAELYEAALTVMMRLVFLLSAEERGLLLLGDERYEAHYALSTLRMQLRAESDEILERRWDAWSRLLTLFRAVFGGIEHENLRMPALGGSLFDPDRFPFLEGRGKGTQWRRDPATPLPIDNRTVLLLLEAIQQFQGRTLSYRALDVEQIGYVYEGLLERTVKRAADFTVELDATKSAKSPWVTLTELETACQIGNQPLAELLRERSGCSARRIRNDLGKLLDDVLAERLLTACHGKLDLRDRVRHYAHLLRTDPWGYPLVYPKGSFMVTTGSDRRESGTHYTPKSLTEAIVTETLTPAVYLGPAEGKPREEWQLKTPAELLELKICDPAMGSGAFLVQVCRWLAERLVEAWAQAETSGKYITVDGDMRDQLTSEEPLPRDIEERSIIARRLIAERCLYGVDLNPLAVELAKLSIWLVTLAKGRPFGFLDHNLRCGDSLLGIHRLDQLTELRMTPGRKNVQMRLFGRNIEQAVVEAIELRKRLRQMPIRDIHDVEAMARLDTYAKAKLEAPERIADAFIAEIFRSGKNINSLELSLTTLSIEAEQYLQGDAPSVLNILKRADEGLCVSLHANKGRCKAFHWPLEFPEVFSGNNPGFDACLGNPPFLGGKRITSVFGEKYTFGIKKIISDKKGAADISAYFMLRAFSILRHKGVFSLVVTNSINEGDTREIGLSALCSEGGEIYFAETNRLWPGSAGVTISVVSVIKGNWGTSRNLNGQQVDFINEFLSDHRTLTEPFRLESNKGMASIGTYVNGKGFILSPSETKVFIEADMKNKEVIQHYLTSQDINQRPDSSPSRFIINFGDMPEEKAKTYVLPYKRVFELVKPSRDKLTRQIHEACFWKHWDRRNELYAALKLLKRALVIGRVSSRHALTFMDIRWMPFDGVVVFLWDDFAHFGLFQSSIHEIWCDRFRTTLREDLRYSISDCFMTFARPEVGEISSFIEKIAERYYLYRQTHMQNRSEGLTTTYNRFHNPSENSQDILELRHLHTKLDISVLSAYGWHEINLEHKFHQTIQGVQYTVSEKARREVLERLLELNHQRYDQEISHERRGKSTAKIKSDRALSTQSTHHSEAQPSSIQTSLFDLPEQDKLPIMSLGPRTGNAWGSNATDQILAWLEAHKGCFTKSAILNGCGANPDAWDTAINELIKDGFVDSVGETHKKKYKAA